MACGSAPRRARVTSLAADPRRGPAPAAAQVLDDTLATDSLNAARHRRQHRPLPRGARAGGGPGAGAARSSRRRGRGRRSPASSSPATRSSGLSGATVGDLLAQVPGRLPLARRVHRPAGAGELSGPRRDVGRVLPRRRALRRRRRRQRRRWIPRSSRSAFSTGSRSSAGPGMLRVYLFTRRHDRLAPRSRIGDRPRRPTTSPATRRDLERRFPLGLGFALAGRLPQLARPRAVDQQQLLQHAGRGCRAATSPRARFGVQYQLVRSRPKRQRLHDRRRDAERHDRRRVHGDAHRRAVPAGASRRATTAPAPGSI